MIGLSTYGLTNMTFNCFQRFSFKKKLIVIKLEIKGNSRFQTKEGKKKKRPNFYDQTRYEDACS